MKYISFVAGAATALLQYMRPLDNTWIGHDKWASENLQISAIIGAVVGATLFFARPHLSKFFRYLILFLVALGFIGGMAVSIYLSQHLTSIPKYVDQIFYRDTVWKLAHLCGTMCLTILLFCLSFLEDNSLTKRAPR